MNGRIQEMIATITIAEKEERSKGKKVNKILLGYDPDVWRETDMQIRDSEQNLQEFHKLNMSPPVKGKHKFSHCDVQYKDIHRFIAKREWAATKNESTTSGVTWLELFILFDHTGVRSHNGTHERDLAATRRAKERSCSAEKKSKGEADSKRRC